ncbi:MAG: glycosyltransferase family 4 protein [Clostridia bacterium]
MKILIDASASFLYQSTGIGSYATELINGFREISPAADIFLFSGEAVYSLHEKDLPAPETETAFWERICEKRAAVPDSFDLYHNLHNGIAMKDAAKKKIVTIHDMIPFILSECCGSPYRELFLSQTTAAAEQADAVITVSENSKKDILRFTRVREENIHVIYEAPKRRCKPLPPAMTAEFLRSRYHLSAPFFLYVGGFNKRKNVAGLIRGYAEVYRRFPYICPLVIVGKEGHRRKHLEELAESLSVAQYIKFVGYVPDGELPFFYNQCKALIYPSFYEGFGLPPLEAAACRSAVIISRRASLPEIMGDCALYAEAEDPVSIGNQMKRLLDDEKERNRLAEKAYRHSQNFSYRIAAKETLKLYENICR